MPDGLAVFRRAVKAVKAVEAVEGGIYILRTTHNAQRTTHNAQRTTHNAHPTPGSYPFGKTLGTAPVNHTPISNSAAPRSAMGHIPPIPMAVSTTSTAYQ